MAREQFYSQASNSVIIDGFALEDFFEGDDAIAWEPEGDAITATRGLDKNALSFGSPRPGRLTIKLKPTSVSIERLNELVNAQERGTPRLFAGQVTTGVKDILNMEDCGIIDNGFTTGGPTMQAREYVIVCANYDVDV